MVVDDDDAVVLLLLLIMLFAVDTVARCLLISDSLGELNCSEMETLVDLLGAWVVGKGGFAPLLVFGILLLGVNLLCFSTVFSLSSSSAESSLIFLWILRGSFLVSKVPIDTNGFEEPSMDLPPVQPTIGPISMHVVPSKLVFIELKFVFFWVSR